MILLIWFKYDDYVCWDTIINLRWRDYCYVMCVLVHVTISDDIYCDDCDEDWEGILGGDILVFTSWCEEYHHMW